ncbi:MAG: thiamine pyrophosphate-binding protein [Bryobacteraceae bacterium]
MPNGARLFVGAAARLGIDTVFTLVGDHLNEVLWEAAQAGMRIVDLRHESGVTHAADAWARIHRRPALSLVTGGPGHTNSLTGIATAQLAGSPLIAVSGSRPSHMGGRNAFQDIDQLGMARPVVKWAGEPPDADAIPAYLERAYREADSGRKGAVHLTIPVNLFMAEAKPAAPGDRLQAGQFPPEPAPAAFGNRLPIGQLPPEPARQPVPCREVLEMLRAAQRPVAIAGSGIWWARAEEALRGFIERTGLPLYTITMARGTVSDDHPLVMGYADPALNYAVHTAFREADLFLAIGKRIDYRLGAPSGPGGGTRLFPAEARFIQVDIHAQELGLNRKLDLAICADAREALEQLTEAAGPEKWPERPWVERLRGLRADWRGQLEGAASDGSTPLHPAAFFRELGEALPPDVLYSWDGGDFAHWGRAMLPARQAGGWLRLGPLGTIGSSLPNGLALQLAHPDRRVVAITGDGALGFYIAEMDSLVRHRLPLVLIVGNDAAWGLERELQSAAAHAGVTGPAGTVACELRSTRYDVVMQGFGGAGETVERLEQVRPAVARALAAGQPYCLNVKIRGARSPFTAWQIAGKARQPGIGKA